MAQGLEQLKIAGSADCGRLSVSSSGLFVLDFMLTFWYLEPKTPLFEPLDPREVQTIEPVEAARNLNKVTKFS